MPLKPIALPPTVARNFICAMRAFFAEKIPSKPTRFPRNSYMNFASITAASSG
jgi:hypothetical protein